MFTSIIMCHNIDDLMLKSLITLHRFPDYPIFNTLFFGFTEAVLPTNNTNEVMACCSTDCTDLELEATPQRIDQEASPRPEQEQGNQQTNQAERQDNTTCTKPPPTPKPRPIQVVHPQPQSRVKSRARTAPESGDGAETAQSSAHSSQPHALQEYHMLPVPIAKFEETAPTTSSRTVAVATYRDLITGRFNNAPFRSMLVGEFVRQLEMMLLAITDVEYNDPRIPTYLARKLATIYGRLDNQCTDRRFLSYVSRFFGSASRQEAILFVGYVALIPAETIDFNRAAVDDIIASCMRDAARHAYEQAKRTYDRISAEEQVETTSDNEDIIVASD